MKNMVELRDALSKNFQALDAGTMEIKQAEAMTNIAGKMISSAMAQLKMAEINGDRADIAFLREPATQPGS